jgi:beta-lactamase superfamily II metal-dependent hydrolase
MRIIAGQLVILRKLLQAVIAVAMLAGCAKPGAAPEPAGTLDVYVVDVEGGQAVLVRTPSGESVLLDAGFPGDGTFASKPGDPAAARDAQRILAAARDARVDRIDYVIMSHYHADHLGGVMELAPLLPMGTFVDHAAPTAEAETAVPGTRALYDAYAVLRAKGRHIQPKPGDRIPIGGGLEAIVVAIDGSVLTAPLAGAGQPNSACVGEPVAAQEKTENPLSLAVILQYGQFRLLDPGDLSGAPLHALTCPVNRIGRVDAYLVAHHGGNDGSDSSLFAAAKPLAAIMSNGPRKGAQGGTIATLNRMPSIDGWQLHRTTYRDSLNVPNERIANLDLTTSAWIKLSASATGSFTVTNGRTGVTRSYRR